MLVSCVKKDFWLKINFCKKKANHLAMAIIERAHYHQFADHKFITDYE